MPIKPHKIIDIPAQSFDKLWACNINIAAPVPGEEASASVTFLPYNDLGEVSYANVEVVSIDNILKKTQDQGSTMAKAMYFLLLAIEEEYVAKHNKKEEVAIEPEP